MSKWAFVHPFSIFHLIAQLAFQNCYSLNLNSTTAELETSLQPLNMSSIEESLFTDQLLLETTRRIEEAAEVLLADINANSRKSEIFKLLLDPNMYDPKIRPRGVNGSGPVPISISVYLRSIENIDDIRMEYTIQITYRQEWIDPRLRYSHIQTNIEYLQLDPSDKIWTPDVFFANEKIGNLHELIAPNYFARVFPNGRVLQSYRISLLLYCPMVLKSYPLDIQSCPVRMTSYGWTTEDLVLNWRLTSPIEMPRQFSMAIFSLKKFATETCTSKTSSGNYSCIQLQLIFGRQFGYYLLQIYIPCTMLVTISWISFWLDSDAVEARVSLSVTTILTIVTETYGINQSVPPASYIKAIDVWTTMCQLMVFGVLLEYSFVNYIANFQWRQRYWENKLTESTKRKLKLKQHFDIDDKETMQEKARMKAKRLDDFSKIIFPLIFCLFNLSYWPAYLLTRT